MSEVFQELVRAVTRVIAGRPLDPALQDWLDQIYGPGSAAGWKVYPPGSAHCPTVRPGRAIVLYLLPEGRIEFSRAG